MLADLRSTSLNEQRLLIVDDHALSRVAIVVTFRLQGYECFAVGTPDDALASIDSFAPRIVLLEWAFRDTTLRGLGLASRLRERSLAHGRPLSIIVVSHAEKPPGFLEREGVEAYFTKPVAPHVLSSAVAEHSTSVREGSR